jgi:hypothetical protein
MDVQYNSQLRYQKTSTYDLASRSIHNSIDYSVSWSSWSTGSKSEKKYDGRVCNCCTYLPISVGESLAKRWISNVYWIRSWVSRRKKMVRI